LKINLKTRIWLLALLSLAGMGLVLVMQYRASTDELTRNAAMVERLERSESLSRLVQELQRERGLSSAFLADRDARARAELLAQHTATDLRLAEREAQLQGVARGLGALGPARERIERGEASHGEAFDFYTAMVSSILGDLARLAMESGAHPMQGELFAHAHLAHAKEYLGQVRATLMAAQSGAIDPAWNASMGRRVGLFDMHLDRYLRDAEPALRDTLAAALVEPEMRLARRLVDQAMNGKLRGGKEDTRQRRYETVTVAIDELRQVERYSLIELRRKAGSLQAASRFRVTLERGALLLVSALFAYLAISSMQNLLRALEAVLLGSRRAARKRGGGTALAGAGEWDEAGEISQSFDGLLDLVDRLNVKASTDALTGAMNRHGFAEISAGELQRARRYQRNLSMILLDLDHFKAINDRHGHATGDRVLRVLARTVSDNLRAADSLIRWGGEEFIILTPETSRDEAERIAEKLRLLIRECRAEGLPHFTASFGVAEFAAGDDMETLFAKADQALYRAKQGGRDRVVVYRPSVETANEAASGEASAAASSDAAEQRKLKVVASERTRADQPELRPEAPTPGFRSSL
jgi:diguanylate cyclase (GGDEF)-like protein